MIVFDLTCENGHSFEGWFKDGCAFENQNSQKLIRCPVCGSFNNRIVPASVMYVGKEASSLRDRRPKEISVQRVCDLLKQFVDRHCEDVGDRLAEVAVKVHQGLEAEKNIKGTVTRSEEEYLSAEGVPFLKIPFFNKMNS